MDVTIARVETGFRRYAHVTQCQHRQIWLDCISSLYFVDFKEQWGHLIYSRKIGAARFKIEFCKLEYVWSECHMSDSLRRDSE